LTPPPRNELSSGVPPDPDVTPILSVDLPDEAATALLAADIAMILRAGDVIALSGGLGVGKTTFARALLRALAPDPALEVPSPTFTLVQVYATAPVAVAHFDLYRLSGPDELVEIGFADAVGDGAVLVEWPDRAGDLLPADRLTVTLEIAGAGRRATLSGGGTWAARLARTRAIRALLDSAGWPAATRRHLKGDASSRRYERVGEGNRTAVLMDWPARGMLAGEDPRAAFRARDVRAFLAVGEALRAAGLSAPEVYATDVPAGLVLMEDFGTEGVLRDGTPDPERYRAVVEVLAAIHAVPRPRDLPIPGGGTHALMDLSPEVLSADVAMFADWYVPRVLGAPLTPADRTDLHAVWQGLFARLADAEQSWVLFDVQSANLFWLLAQSLIGRAGLARVGLIDFQDMFRGPSAYDVAAIAQDARATVPEALERDLTAHYVAARKSADPAFDAPAFAEAYAILAAARGAKNLGVFARLAALGDPAYLPHIPRVGAYLRRTLAVDVLSPLRLWYEERLPP
jgi:tRNA threonylcarbamoyl adenosine modification protein YjeE